MHARTHSHARTHTHAQASTGKHMHAHTREYTRFIPIIPATVKCSVTNKRSLNSFLHHVQLRAFKRRPEGGGATIGPMHSQYAWGHQSDMSHQSESISHLRYASHQHTGSGQRSFTHSVKQGRQSSYTTTEPCHAAIPFATSPVAAGASSR